MMIYVISELEHYMRKHIFPGVTLSSQLDVMETGEISKRTVYDVQIVHPDTNKVYLTSESDLGAHLHRKFFAEGEKKKLCTNVKVAKNIACAEYLLRDFEEVRNNMFYLSCYLLRFIFI